MKKNIFKVALIAGIVSFGLIACNETPSEKEVKVEEAQENLDEAQQSLEQATTDSINDYQVFKKDAEMKLQSNDEKIAMLKAKMTSDKKDLKIKYEKKINELETKNNNLKDKINNSKDDDKTNWESFKQNFNEEMDDLGKSISDMAQKNMDSKD
jgi:phosphoenolpyruvate-protein kinase (PTS system EI component)